MPTYQNPATGNIGSLLRLIEEEKSKGPLATPPGTTTASPVRGLVQEPLQQAESPESSRVFTLRPETAPVQSSGEVVPPVELSEPVAPIAPTAPVAPGIPGEAPVNRPSASPAFSLATKILPGGNSGAGARRSAPPKAPGVSRVGPLTLPSQAQKVSGGEVATGLGAAASFARQRLLPLATRILSGVGETVARRIPLFLPDKAIQDLTNRLPGSQARRQVRT